MRLYAESLFHLQGLLQSVQYSLRSKQSDRSKPLAAWASEGLDSHHPEAQLPLQIFTVTCLTLPHPEFKEACDTSDICTHTAKHNISFSVLLAERISSFTYKKKKGRFWRPRSARAREVPPRCQAAAALQPLCAPALPARWDCTVISTDSSRSARRWKSIMQFYSAWGTKQLYLCNGASPLDRQAEAAAALDPPLFLIPN